MGCLLGGIVSLKLWAKLLTTTKGSIWAEQALLRLWHLFYSNPTKSVSDKSNRV